MVAPWRKFASPPEIDAVNALTVPSKVLIPETTSSASVVRLPSSVAPKRRARGGLLVNGRSIAPPFVSTLALKSTVLASN